MLDDSRVPLRRGQHSRSRPFHRQSTGLSRVPVDEEQADLARRAFRKYGKGRHPASLNFGDCFSYALARALDEPLLFKGNDFPQTDVKRHPATSE